ncbi:MAG TPA: cupredoxin domain-containing protein [Acidimicrobiales bacterium]|nr:cupredoxin domain-containing protein [Acidimicrobiales bacterium]
MATSRHHRPRHPPLWVAGVAAVLTLMGATGCSKSSKSATATTTTTSATTTTASAAALNQGAVVKVSEYQFTAPSVTVKAGQEIVWRNDGNVAHTVTETSGHDFNSPDIAPGQTYVQTFDKPGTYTYICSIHPDRMHGTIVVTASG